jgi:MGT family glycosyltransferase
VAEIARRRGFPLDARRVDRAIELDLHFRGVPEWALSAPAMELPRRRPPPNELRFIGPCVDLERRETAAEPQGERRRLYVSVGTVEQMSGGDAEFLGKVVEAFAGADDLEVVIAAGNAATAQALGTPPPPIRVAQSQPQLAMLAGASLAISHGGAGTIREATVSGVPLLVYPRNDDQFGGGARVAFHGMGLAGDRLRATPTSIRQLARTILSDGRFRERAARMRDEVARFQAAVDFRGLVEEAIALASAAAPKSS